MTRPPFDLRNSLSTRLKYALVCAVLFAGSQRWADSPEDLWFLLLLGGVLGFFFTDIIRLGHRAHEKAFGKTPPNDDA